MNTVKFSVEEDIPIIKEADVLVCGGGPGGLGAAIMAARMGAKVVLVEKYGKLGGMASIGEISPFMGNHVRCGGTDEKPHYTPLDKPVYGQWVMAMAKYLPQSIIDKWGGVDQEVTKGCSGIISTELAALGAEDLCREAGVDVVFHHTLVRAIVKDGVIDCVVFASKSGFVAMRAKNYVDATGDADLTIMAGGKADIGNEQGYCQPMTLCFKLEHIDRKRVPANLGNELYNQAKAAGKIHCPRENLLFFNWYTEDVLHFNTTRVIKKSPVNGLELSEAEAEAHRQLREIVQWLIKEVPGFEQAQLRSVGTTIGVRESRRIHGLNRIGREAFTNRSHYLDGIARCNYTIDIHNPMGEGTEREWMPKTEFYEIPFGCIVPEGIKNLAVGGRPISVDHALHSSMRVMPPAISIGQAAGVAAALSCQNGTPLCELDGCDVRKQLISMGANL